MISPHGTHFTRGAGARRARRRGRLTSITALLALLAVFVLASAVVPSGAAAALGKPTAKTPAGGISNATPTYTWSKVSGATRYELRVYNGTTQVFKKTGLTKASWQSTTAVPKNVDLTWKVRAGNAAGTGPWSGSLAFTALFAF